MARRLTKEFAPNARRCLMADAPAAFEDRADKSLLIVDDDRPFSTRLARAMEGRGYQVRVAESVADGIAAIETEAAGLRRDRHAPRRRQRARRDRAPEEPPPGCPRRHPHRLRQHRHRGHGGEDGRLRLPGEARRCGRDPCRPDGAARRARRCRPKTRCRRTGCAGSTSSASTSSAAATSRKPPAASTCTAAPCSGSWPSARRGRVRLALPLPQRALLLRACESLRRARIRLSPLAGRGLPKAASLRSRRG